MEFEGDAVYLHREDYENGLTGNGLWVEGLQGMRDKLVALSDHYVMIEGTMDAKNQGHLGLWSGAIVEIDRVIKWPPEIIPLKLEGPTEDLSENNLDEH
jgi:hypothetical protein